MSSHYQTLKDPDLMLQLLDTQGNLPLGKYDI